VFRKLDYKNFFRNVDDTFTGILSLSVSPLLPLTPRPLSPLTLQQNLNVAVAVVEEAAILVHNISPVRSWRW
jgi:hypothetical protein